MPHPWVSLRHDGLILVNKAVNEKEQFEKRSGDKRRNERYFSITVVGTYIECT
jgi:hypothetical protein